MPERQSTVGQLLKALTGSVEAPEDWRPLIDLAGETLTIGALALTIMSSGHARDLPHSVRDLLLEVLQRTRERNRRLKDQLIELLPPLNACGVRPILMRGMASLVEEEGESARLIADIDILIPRHRRKECARTFHSLGYEVVQGVHGPPFSIVMGRSQDVGMVDLHTDIQPYALNVDYDRLAPLCRAVTIGEGRALVPSTTCALVLNILHDQLHDGDYWRGLIDVRHLIETIDLVRPGTDWKKLTEFFPIGAPRNAMHLHLRTAKAMLGISIPEEHCGGMWANLQLKRRLLQLRAPGLMPVLTVLTAMMDSPRRLAADVGPKFSRRSNLKFKMRRALRPPNAGKLTLTQYDRISAGQPAT